MQDLTPDLTYDVSNRLLRAYSKKVASGAILTDFTYAWKQGTTDRGLRQSVTEKNGSKTSCSYDVLNRLTRAEERTGTGTLLNSWAYSYDANSNRSSQTVNGVTTGYSHNAADQLSAAGTTTYTYDLNGNETGNSAGRTASYNAKDQVVSATPPGGAPIPMSYTGTGQFHRVTRGSSGYTDSALGLSREDTTSYTRDDDGLLLGMRTSTGNYYYLLDGLGSVAAVTAAAGTVVATYSYEPFGKLKSSTGALANPWRWLGALGVYHDGPTGHYKMGTRYYDPALGRFTQVDPVVGGSANSYDYAAQNPVNNVDTDGAVFWTVVTIAASVAIYHFTADNKSWKGYLAAAAGGAGFRVLAAGRGIGVGNARLALHGRHAKKLQKMKSGTRKTLQRYKKHQNRPHAHLDWKKRRNL